MTIIETSTGIIQNPKVKVNKIITIYPKREIEKLIQSLKPDKVIYIKKWAPIPAPIALTG